MPADHDRIYFDFDIKGDYGYDEIKVSLYYNSVTTANQINFMRWNREGDNDLNWPNYVSVDNYFRNPPYSSNNGLWLTNWCDVLFRTDPGTKFILVVEYDGVEVTKYYTVPYGDSDGDGFNDNVDNCPNTPGPDYGCPVGEPDLALDESDIIIFSDCQNCDPRLSNLNGRHIIKNAIHFNSIIVNNNGNSSSTNTDLDFYITKDNELNSNATKLSSETVNISSISAGGFSNETQSISYSSLQSKGLNYRYYYMFIVLDIDDSNNDNNSVRIPVSYEDIFRSPEPIKPAPFKSSFSTSKYENSTYDMEIYNFSGSKIKQSQNLSAEEKEQVISELPKGYYIIKTQETKTTKIKKN